MKKKRPIQLRESMDCHVRGRISYMLGDGQGRPCWSRPGTVDNVVVTSGRAWLLKHIMSAQNPIVGAQIIQALAIGSGTTAPTVNDVLLAAELNRAPYFSETDNTISIAPNVIWAASWATNQGNGTLAECGIFNTTVAGQQTMLARAVFTATFVKTTSNTLTVSYTLSA